MKKDLLSNSETFFFATSKTPFSVSQEKKGRKIKSQHAASGFQVYASQPDESSACQDGRAVGWGRDGGHLASRCAHQREVSSQLTCLLLFLLQEKESAYERNREKREGGRGEGKGGRKGRGGERDPERGEEGSRGSHIEL